MKQPKMSKTQEWVQALQARYPGGYGALILQLKNGNFQTPSHAFSHLKQSLPYLAEFLKKVKIRVEVSAETPLKTIQDVLKEACWKHEVHSLESVPELAHLQDLEEIKRSF